MVQDDILREIREFRESYAARFGCDVGAMLRDLREQERTGGRQVVSLPARQPSRSAHPRTSLAEEIGAESVPTDDADRDVAGESVKAHC